MNIRFILFPLPLVLLFSVMFSQHMIVGDFQAHLDYLGGSTYPPFLAWLLGLAGGLISRDIALFVISLLSIVYLPYVVVFMITHRVEAAWMYLYGSGVPLILGVIWFVPQSLIHVLMLLSVLSWWWLIPFLFFGSLIHSAWIYGFIAVVFYKLFYPVVEK